MEILPSSTQLLFSLLCVRQQRFIYKELMKSITMTLDLLTIFIYPLLI